MSLLASRAPRRLPLRVGHTSVRNAASSGGGGSGKPEVAQQGDPKKDTLRRVLYPANVRQTSPSPVGAWRPDVARALQHAVPSAQAHDTVLRAWQLHERRQREARAAELGRKLRCMREAMEELARVDVGLYQEANRAEDPRRRGVQEEEAMKGASEVERRAVDSRARGLFPRELRIPTDTPPRDGWTYEWKPFKRPQT
ncbi:hypothetical protein CONPUDRAFT_79275 [Coniophora puteana RWD-64-598 SS2]|uniref:Large ribosomal subunit protein mL40 n=1 Tax=Coniophora puteana (strain RWD-64-598) TaxID=741705 RepID=A0A5M3N6Q3_CONPW|nr:uncharacterized protein CONPUDRAFT_79275 [Coniophora puteana RWD-64-598 SS2]EIW87112.1 hypothetical protein CONPUDRAFT_79275 [Coniophora puteana RWD-64-598 SS2]